MDYNKLIKKDNQTLFVHLYLIKNSFVYYNKTHNIEKFDQNETINANLTLERNT